jgi:hypothetical protein
MVDRAAGDPTRTFGNEQQRRSAPPSYAPLRPATSGVARTAFRVSPETDRLPLALELRKPFAPRAAAMRRVQEEEDALEGSEPWPDAELRRRRGAAEERIENFANAP